MPFSDEQIELRELLEKCGSDLTEATKIVETVEKERGIVNTQGYYIYFRYFELKQFVLTIPEWVKNAPVYIHMSLAFGATGKCTPRRKKTNRTSTETTGPRWTQTITKV